MSSNLPMLYFKHGIQIAGNEAEARTDTERVVFPGLKYRRLSAHASMLQNEALSTEMHVCPPPQILLLPPATSAT